MFELTDTLTYAVPVMLSVLVAKTVADALEPKGIYDLVIELNQLPYLDSKHEYLWQNLQISDAVCVYYYVTSYHLLILPSDPTRRPSHPHRSEEYCLQFEGTASESHFFRCRR